MAIIGPDICLKGVLCPNLTKLFQKEVSQIANFKLSRATTIGGLNVNLNHLKTVDARDPFLIYRVNDGNMNDMPDFVFKTSKEMLLLAHQMNQGGPDNPLKDEVVYFDGSHSRCTGFITLGLFVLHPGMRSLLRLCSM